VACLHCKVYVEFLVYHALYLDNLTESHLREKLANLYDILPTQILELYLEGPSGIHILVTDLVSVRVGIFFTITLCAPSAMCCVALMIYVHNCTVWE